MPNINKTIILTLSLLTLLSCGYQFQSRIIKLEGVASFSEITVKNETYEPELEHILKYDLTKVFSSNKWLNKKRSDEEEPALFLCNVTEFDNSAASHTVSDSISWYEVTLTFDVTVYKRSDSDKIIFSAKNRKYAERYQVDNDIKVTERNKKNAIIRISDKFSHDMEDSISQGF